MLATMIQKELRSILLSPKFSATFATCTLLLLLSVFTGIQEYQAARESYDIGTSLAEGELRQETSWRGLETRVYREPNPMQILVAGLSNDVGRWSEVNPEQAVKLRHSAYSDDPIFAVFRFIDFAFIVQFVMTLLAILFTYDAVSGEREQGTLKLVFSNAIGRTQYVIAKCLGAWLGLAVPISIPILLSICLLPLFGISLTAEHWISIGGLVGMSMLLFTFFIVLGVMVSTLSSRSSVSFLVGLVLWAAFVLIIPRAAIMSAEQLISVPRVAEIEAQRDAFAADKWNTFSDRIADIWTDADSDTNGDAMADEDEAATDAAMWAAIKKQDSLRREVEKEIEAYELRLLEDLRQRKITQEKLAYSLSRISPVSAYQLAAMRLAETDVADKIRWEEALSEYRQDFNSFAEVQGANSDDIGGVMISLTMEENEDGETEGGLSIAGNRDKDVLDLSEMPRFVAPIRNGVATAAAISIDVGILALSILFGFAVTFVRFLRYDLR